jgi:hypothetical protein
MSAQETVLGHASSNLALISSITSKPLIEFLFGKDFFSLTIVALSSNNTDASQPCKNEKAGSFIYASDNKQKFNLIITFC